MTKGVTLVTGAAGFAGRFLLDRLSYSSAIAAWHRPGGRPGDPERRVTWQAVDITDRDGVTQAIEEIQPTRIFHLAGAPNVATSWANAVSHLKINALGTHHILEAIRRSGRPCRLVVVTSALVYHATDDPIREDAVLRPSNPYGLSKLAQDQLALRAAHDEHLDVVVARPFNHIGPRQEPGFAVSNFARQIARIEAGLAPPQLQVGNLEARRDITDVRDVVEAYERLMDRGVAGRAYNICSGRAWRMQDLLDELLHLSSSKIRVETDPTRLRPNDVPIVQGDATRIRSELGWMPRIRVEQTLQDTLEWWRRETAESLASA